MAFIIDFRFNYNVLYHGYLIISTWKTLKEMLIQVQPDVATLALLLYNSLVHKITAIYNLI